MLYKQSIDTNSERYFFLANKRISKKGFLVKAKVNSKLFAGEILGKLYDCMMAEAVDLQNEYETFHNDEYPTFEEFLEKKYVLRKKRILIIKRYLSCNRNLRILCRPAHAYDYAAERLVFYDKLSPMFIGLVMGRRKYENKNRFRNE